MSFAVSEKIFSRFQIGVYCSPFQNKTHFLQCIVHPGKLLISVTLELVAWQGMLCLPRCNTAHSCKMYRNVCFRDLFKIALSQVYF